MYFVAATGLEINNCQELDLKAKKSIHMMTWAFFFFLFEIFRVIYSEFILKKSR